MPKVIRVDQQGNEPYDGTIQWSYENACQGTEFVEYVENSKTVRICNSTYSDSEIYIHDIPKLILALQAAHKHITNS